MINESYLKLQTALKPQLDNDSDDTLELGWEELELIMKVNYPELIQELFQGKQKLSVVGRNNIKVKISLDWNIDENLLGVSLFQKVDTTTFGNLIFLGWGEWSQEQKYPTFFIFGNKVVSYWEEIVDKQSCLTKGFKFFDYSAISIIRRLQQHIQNHEQKKLDTILTRLDEVPEETLKSIITYKNLKHLLLEADTNIINSVLIYYIQIRNKFEPQYYQDLFLKLLRNAVENNKSLIVRSLLTLEHSPILTAKEKCLPMILKILNHFKGRITREIILEFFTSLFFDEKIVLEELHEEIFSENNLNIFLAAQLFYTAISNSRKAIDCLPELTLSFRTDYIIGLALFKNLVLSILNFPADIDISFLKNFIIVTAVVCQDEKNENYTALSAVFMSILIELYGIDFDQSENKSVFTNNTSKANFFEKHLSFFAADFASGKQSMNNKKQEVSNRLSVNVPGAVVPTKPKEFDVTEDALFDIYLKKPQTALDKLYAFQMGEFNQETKKILLKLASSLNKDIAAKAYYKLAEVEIGLSSTEEDKLKSAKIEAYLAKSLLLGYQLSLQMLKQYFPQSSARYILIQNFTENVEKTDYLLVLTKDNVVSGDFKFLEKIILDCKRQLPILVLRLGYFYSHPEFFCHNPTAAYNHLESMLYDQSLTKAFRDLISYYRKTSSFDGAETYADFLEKRLSPPVKLLIQKLSSSEVLENLGQLAIKESGEDMNQVFFELHQILTKLMQDRSDLATQQARLTSQKDISDNNDNSLLKYNRILLELRCIKILSEKLSGYQSKIKSKEQLISYLNEFQTKLINFSPEKTLSRLIDEITKISNEIQANSSQNSLKMMH